MQLEKTYQQSLNDNCICYLTMSIYFLIHLFKISIYLVTTKKYSSVFQQFQNCITFYSLEKGSSNSIVFEKNKPVFCYLQCLLFFSQLYLILIILYSWCLCLKGEGWKRNKCTQIDVESKSYNVSNRIILILHFLNQII